MSIRFAIALTAALGLACAKTPAPAPSAAPEPTPAPEPVSVSEPVPEVEPAPEPEPGAEAEPESAPAPDIPELSEKLVERVMKQQAQVQLYAAKHEVDPDLVNAIIWVESKFDPRAKGPAGAMGLMQLMPRTAGSLAKRLGRRSRPYDPDFALDAGCLYIHRIQARFEGDLRLSLAAYNRGVGKVKAWVEAGEALPERTAAYVDRVLAAKAWLPLLIARVQADEAAPSEPAVSALEGTPARVMLSP